MKEINKNQLEAMINNKESFIVDFFVDWCGKCQSVEAWVQKYKEKYEFSLPLYKINLNSDPSVREDFNIVHLPTIVVFKNGKEFKRSDAVSTIRILNKYIVKE